MSALPKKPVRKLDLNETNVNKYIDFLKAIKMPFVMEVSNYTTRIISEGYNVHFMKQEQSNRVFGACAKIKSDLKNKEVPEIDMQRNCYYDTAFKGDGFYSDFVTNIDLKCAYATILYNDGFIKKKTFDYIKSLPKQDRLAALGMLASRKDIFHHNKNGDVYRIDERVSPLSNFFFYCVQKTEKIIQSYKNEFLSDRFLFSWVDGIYHNSAAEVMEYKGRWLPIDKHAEVYFKNEFRMEIKIEILRDFEVQLKNGFYKISFLNMNERVKKFNIPVPETDLKNKIIHHLLNKNYK